MERGGTINGYTALLLIAGVLAGVAAEMAGGPSTVPWVEVPLLLAVLTLASHLIIRFQLGDQIEALDLFDAVLAPTIAVFPGTVVVGVVVLAKVVVGIAHRNEPMKARFNVAQWAAATGCGSLVFALLRSGTGLTARNLGAIVAAMVVVALANHAAFAVVIALAEGRPLRQVLRGLKAVILLGWLGGSTVNVAFGILFVSAYLRSPYAVVVMVVPLAVLHWASRGFATARTDHVRLSGLQAATHALAGPIDPREALPSFLAEVRRCFEADAVDLLVQTPGGPVRHRVMGELPYWHGADDGTSTAARLLAAVGDSTLVVDARRDERGLLAPEQWRVAAATPVRTGDRTFGVLCVYNRGGAEGFEGGEIVVLQALGAEVAGALEKAELLAGMLEERRQLADIVGNTSDGILALDESGNVAAWNAGLAQITGYAADVIVGRSPDLVLRPRDSEGNPVDLATWPGAVDTLPELLEVTTADRQSRWLSCSYTGVPPRDGRGAQLVVMARDITKAHELEKLKDDFVAVVSHEMRTPLAPIKGWAVTLLTRSEDLTEDQRREGARSILRQADRLEQLILNILEDSRVENDVAEGPADEVVDVSEVVARVVEDVAILAPERTFTVHGGGTPAFVSGRGVRVHQVLANLVANAVKYSPKHESIEVSVERGPGEVLISVTDHGPGIPPDARERVFERFERLPNATTQTGTGLGLYIARRLATSMDAELDLTPATGGGSTFTLRMRAVRRLTAVATA